MTTSTPTTTDVTAANVMPTNRWTLICARMSRRSVVHVGSPSMWRNTANFWIVASSDCSYCGASATTPFLLASARPATATSTSPMSMMDSV